MSSAGIVLMFAPVLAFVIAWWVRAHAHSHRLLDVPNERSSHSVPTPRGGGLGVVASVVVGVVVLTIGGDMAAHVAAVYAGAALLVAMVGMLDDMYGVSVRLRLVVHFIAIVLGLVALGELPYPFSQGVLLAPLVVGLVWFLNLYNFMDGIDGLATMETVSVSLGLVLLAWVVGRNDLVLAPALMGLAALGFLPWNAAPARVFMGDVGSGFIGCALGFMAVQLSAAAPSLFASCLILPGVFIADASLTLLRRAMAGHAVHQAHRSHAYQHAARRLGSHGRVTASVVAINLLWLLPIALGVAMGAIRWGVGVTMAYLPLLLMAWKLGAGRDG